MANKVKFNLCDVYYALLEKNTETTAEYATPVRLPGAVSLSLDPEGEQEPFFADGIEMARGFPRTHAWNSHLGWYGW